MDESRLLTPAELQKLLIGMKAGEFYPNYIAKAQDAKTLKEIEKELFEIVHSRTKAAAYKKAVKLWQSVSGKQD